MPTVPPVPTEPGPMPDPCSGELDAIMLGEAYGIGKAFFLQAIGRQWGLSANIDVGANRGLIPAMEY